MKRTAAALFFALFLFNADLYAQDFYRIIELQNTRMNGADVRGLQNKLNELGFSEIGQVDGYYGPLTEGVIKNIQLFLGFEQDGRVDINLWNYLFNKNNNTVLVNISVVSKYDKSKLGMREREYMYSSEGGRYYIYSSPDGRVRLLELRMLWSERSEYYDCYYINYSNFFVIHRTSRYEFSMGRGRSLETATTYYIDSSAVYEMKNGVKSASNFNINFLGDIVNENL